MTSYFVVLFVFPQQLHAVIAASVSIKSSQKLKKILEVSEAFVHILNMALHEGRFFFHVLVPCHSDHLGAWKLHEQQQKRSRVRIQAAEFRLGESRQSAFKSHQLFLYECSLEFYYFSLSS